MTDRLQVAGLTQYLSFVICHLSFVMGASLRRAPLLSRLKKVEHFGGKMIALLNK
ncbi:MAG: hypothetical protein WAK31_09395 [Chthoniobacterales bacterium]